MVGLHRVGVVGLGRALEAVDDAGLTEREAIVDLLMDALASDNYVPASQLEAYRTAMWREYLRFKGRDFREFYSEVTVTIRGEPGEDRERFVELTRSALGDFELAPTIEFDSETGEGPEPQLAIGDHTLVAGLRGRDRFKAAVRQSLSDW
jgi:hypothetical protein